VAVRLLPARRNLLAREAVGLGDVSQLARRMDEEKVDYPSIRFRPTYDAMQDVEKTEEELEAIGGQS
jgi:hypothetical protein